MSSLQRVCKSLGVLSLALFVASRALAQPSYVPLANEYLPVGSVPGDQIHAALSLKTSGGYLVWSDNVTDGSGLGISALRLDSSLSSSLSSFRVNASGDGEQERPQVAMLKNGGAVFVWQGGRPSYQHIYSRFISAGGTWLSENDIMVSTAGAYQVEPSVCVLTNGNVIVIWSSFKQDNADGLQGVYGQILSPTGQKIGNEFPVNQATQYNQRSAAVAPLANGQFAVVWISELQRSTNNVDVYGRVYDINANPLSNEFLVNNGTNVCSTPAIASATDGSFVIGWAEKDVAVRNNSWDVFARRFTSANAGGVAQRVNTQRYGDQYAPSIACVGTDYMVSWISLGQDGSREGVYGQFLRADASLSGVEFRVNTTVIGPQTFPAVASDGATRFLAVWSGYFGGVNSLDLYAQRYAAYQAPLNPPGAPFVSALESYSLSVTWPDLAGFSVDHYELYLDGSGNPTNVVGTMWSSKNFNTASTHTFRLAYVLADGRHSPLSDVAVGATWGLDENHDGLPDDWQAMYWGPDNSAWPGANTRLAPNGPTVLTVFAWGANPLDPGTWLRTTMNHTFQGWYLLWNTQAGNVYQVETTTDLIHWSNLGSPRFAAGSSDSLFIGLTNRGYYRLKRVRY